jgi:ribose/xylose/arabinose/galactoside ABC-type transport system permease subunit
MSIAANTAMAHLPAVSALGWLFSSRQRALAESWQQKLSIRLRDVDQPVRELSGGNQQKVVLAKWLATAPDVLILDEPTRGVDVGAKAAIHHLMAQLAREGKAILMVSSDLPEVLAMSDRILVMREGRLVGEFTRENATQESIMSAATGQGRHEQHTSARTKITGALAAKLTRFRELGIAVVVALTLAIASFLQPRFLSAENMRNILLYIPLIMVIAMGQMMVIITRNIDLSVGSVLGFAAIVVGNLFITHPNMPLPVAALIAAALGGAMGLVNGVLVAYCRVPAIIATLGTMSVYRGLTSIYSHGQQVNNNDLPQSLMRLSQTSPVFGIPWIVLLAGAIAVLTALWMRHARTAREILAVGSNPHAAVLRGLPVNRLLLLVFGLTGLLSGLSGLLFASRFGYINPSSGDAMELVVISAVVIGGTNVFGGSGSVLGTVLGCLLLGLVKVALPMLSVPTPWQSVLYGLSILMAAATDAYIQRRTGVAAEAI